MVIEEWHQDACPINRLLQPRDAPRRLEIDVTASHYLQEPSGVALVTNGSWQRANSPDRITVFPRLPLPEILRPEVVDTAEEKYIPARVKEVHRAIRDVIAHDNISNDDLVLPTSAQRFAAVLRIHRQSRDVQNQRRLQSREL